MNPRLLQLFRFFPIFSLLFTSWVCYISVSIDKEVSFIFVFLSFQFYVNWLVVLLKNNPWVKIRESQIDLIGYKKLWFCPKCNKSGADNVEHCPLCKRCVILRDHHCFFLGTCINQRNVRHFICVLFYTVLICVYVMNLLFSYLLTDFQRNEELSKGELASRFFYPVVLGRWLSGQEDFHLFSLVAMFDMLVSIGLSTLVYGLYQTYRIVSGNMFAKYRISSGPHSVRDNLRTVFGRWGFLNILIPIPLSKGETFQYNKLPKYK